MQSLFPMSWLSGLYSSEIQTNWRGERNQIHNKPNITKPSHHSIASHYINHSALMNSKYTTHLFGSRQGSARSQSSEWFLNAGFFVNSRKKINIAVSSLQPWTIPRLPISFLNLRTPNTISSDINRTFSETYRRFTNPIPPSPNLRDAPRLFRSKRPVFRQLLGRSEGNAVGAERREMPRKNGSTLGS